MPDWKDLLQEIRESGSTYDIVRRDYLDELQKLTRRNVIAYYSGWLQKPMLARHDARFGIDDLDKNGFMTCIHRLKRKKGLDLLLHTPGGSAGATESLVDYLRQTFGNNIRAIVPQMAMSGGTMLALGCREILMGKQSSIGPIDPQIMGLPVVGVIEEFETAKKNILEDDRLALLWQPILAHYSPTLIGQCYKARDWAEQCAFSWLTSGMFGKQRNAQRKATAVIRALGRGSEFHGRQIPRQEAKRLGLRVHSLERSQKLQDAVLSVHHAYLLTLTETDAIKIIENHLGVAFVSRGEQPFQETTSS